MKIIVQGQNQKFYEVDIGEKSETGEWVGNRFCPCTGFATKKFCNHLDMAEDIRINSKKRHLYDVISAFHKEIRRSDLRLGVLWARVYAQMIGNDKPPGYAKTILFEETRNLDLFEKYQNNELSEKDQVHKMILSRKKWELPYFKDHYHYWNEGFKNYYKSRDGWHRGGVDGVVNAIENLQTPAEAYEVLTYVQGNYKENEALNTAYWNAITARAARESNERLKMYLTFNPKSYYGRMTAIELMLGYWSEEANEYHPSVEIKDNFVPRLEDYVYDCHNYIGKARLIKNWSEVQSGKITKASKLDLRWSGMLYGIYWRFKCYQQFGSMRRSDGSDFDWDAVHLDPEEWKEIKNFDSYFYSDFYSKVRESSISVPVWKKDYGS